MWLTSPYVLHVFMVDLFTNIMEVNLLIMLCLLKFIFDIYMVISFYFVYFLIHFKMSSYE
ncbi:hypothetical protein GLYMA_15G261400v4 [Glycine max]|uniref:Uncharacterized protein n=1 Tax=Glycine max TaxID=3847 RepID=K7ME07_SOYBN|nr:hypothetical protein JHK86_043726 [Glycine max]KAH1148905.1 hypothetical protein GYH30_043508 [Glycine max]KRH13745.1 hypothetical protein GLYMA_15G261400v4 [Glycine max]